MKLSLETCKLLKEVGFPQDTEFYHIKGKRCIGYNGHKYENFSEINYGNIPVMSRLNLFMPAQIRTRFWSCCQTN